MKKIIALFLSIVLCLSLTIGLTGCAVSRATSAASYNEYVLKNSFVWEGNVPSDIMGNLPYI